MSRFKMVVLSGSMKHWAEIKRAANRENLKGHIVLVPWIHQQNLMLSESDKERYVQMHYQRIDIADEMLVVDPEGYIGESTKNEIAYAKYKGIPIRYVSKEGR